MLTYFVNLQNRPIKETNDILDFDWSLAEEGFVNKSLWPKNDYKPDTRFYLLYDKDNLFGLLLTKGEHELNPRAETKDFQGAVHKDSCLEFFFSYEPDNPAYANLELNSHPTLHFGIGKGRENRVKPSADELRDIKIHKMDSDRLVKGISFAYDWGIAFKIPAKLLNSLWNKYDLANDVLDEHFYSGQVMKANFYKCGDLTAEEHYLAWNEVDTDRPDFHKPEFFANLEFQ